MAIYFIKGQKKKEKNDVLLIYGVFGASFLGAAFLGAAFLGAAFFAIVQFLHFILLINSLDRAYIIIVILASLEFSKSDDPLRTKSLNLDSVKILHKSALYRL